MAATAQRVIEYNGFGNKIQLFNKRSDELIPGVIILHATSASDQRDVAGMDKTRPVNLPAEKMGGAADMVVMEIFDSELIGEGVLPTMRDIVQSGVLKASHSPIAR